MQNSLIKSFFLCFLMNFGMLLQGQNNRIVDSLKTLLSTSAEDTTKVNLLNDIGGYLLNGGKFEEAKDYLEKAKKLAEKLNYKSGLSTAFGRIGIFYMDKSDLVLANENYLKALQLKTELGDKKGIADVTSNIGIAYSDKGEYAKALENYFSALKIREEIKDEIGISISMMSIANIYYLENKFTKALEYYLNLLKVKGVERNKFFLAQVYNNIGLVYTQLNDQTKALNFYNSALKIEEEIGDQLGVAVSLTNIGSVYTSQKNYIKAIDLVLKGSEIFKELGDKKGEVESYYELGNIYDSLDQNSKALEYFRKQLDLALEIKSKVNVKLAYLGISNHFKKINNYKEALNNYLLFKATEDSLKNESSTRTIAELEAKYNSQKKEKEIELLKKEQQLQNIKNAQQKQLIFAIIILVVVISIAVFLFYNRYQLKKKNDLERKNFELERNALSAQMNPHFIFNSLGSIGGFIAENEKEKATEYLGVFSKLIRHNLEQSREQLVSVIQETEMLKSYLHLQQLRFDNKFNYDINIEDGMDDSIALPPMFIQPFVENAILHGILPKQENGTISIKFYTKNEKDLICEITDDGIGKTESLKRKSEFVDVHKSLAMTITEERKNIINSKNKEKIEISINEIINSDNLVVGTRVKLSFPIEYI